MGLCGTCRFWGREPNPDPEFRECLAIHHAQDEQLDSTPPTQEDLERPVQEGWVNVAQMRQEFRTENKAFVLDGSGYLAALKSRSDFGCLLHEPREDES